MRARTVNALLLEVDTTMTTIAVAHPLLVAGHLVVIVSVLQADALPQPMTTMHEMLTVDGVPRVANTGLPHGAMMIPTKLVAPHHPRLEAIPIHMLVRIPMLAREVLLVEAAMDTVVAMAVPVAATRIVGAISRETTLDPPGVQPRTGIWRMYQRFWWLLLD